ncbi:Hypothetical_protein [Hexamita inflata]|uniref:Hypothetical_protein n=1 Tax=Hexamita inflata TaxID=28002 RepID=A0AA86N5A5_9EUKA|nr:Hypothetical protein HINF_LOCUS484 [Hexamita inflata]
MDVALDFLNEPIQELDNKKVEEYVNNLADTQIVTGQQEQINEASELFVTKQQNQNLLLSGIDEVPQVSIAKSQNQNAPEVQIITAKSQKSSRRGSQVDPQESLSSSKPMQLSINVPRVQPAKQVESILSESEIKPTHIEGDQNTVKQETNPELNQIIDNKLEEVLKPIEGNMLESESNLEQQIIGMDEFINDVKKIEIQSFCKCPIVTEVVKVDSEPVSPFQFKPDSKSPDFNPRPQPRMVEFKSIEPIQIKQSINQPIESKNAEFTQQDKQTIQQAFESNNSNILLQKIAALNSSTQKFQNNSQNNSFTKFNKSQFSKIENSSHLLLNVSNINNQSVPLQRTVFKTESNQNDLKNKLNQQIEEMKTRNAIYKQNGVKVETEKDIQILQEFALKIK